MTNVQGLKDFWNFVGRDITKVMKTVALVCGVITGIVAEFVAPLVMLMWLGYKEVPFHMYIMFWVAAALITVSVTLVVGLSTTKGYWNKTRLPYSKVVDDREKFLICPICGGNVEQKIFGGLMPLIGDPTCNSCKTRFCLRGRILLEDEFELIQQREV